MENPKLDPCPFCGETKLWPNIDAPHDSYGGLEVLDFHEGKCWVACHTCDSQGPTEATPQLAIKKWNNRKNGN